ncbi:PKD domain-containing protein [Pontiellaceae bacterium B1224]|nr:PKD domain-containing protein [Pontiellaceae bacterium B1224]
MNRKTKLVMAGLMLAASAAQAVDISYSNTVSTAEIIGAGDRLMQRDGKTATITDGGSIAITSESTAASWIGQSGVGEIIIDGGALSASNGNNFAIGNGSPGNGTIDLRAGTLTVESTGTIIIGRDKGTGVIIIRGGVAALNQQPVFDTHASNLGFGSIDFADKIGGGTSDGTLTISGVDSAYYEALYAGGDLTYNGDNSTYSFSDVFSVIGETLSALPPPQTFAIITPSTTSGYAPLDVVFHGTNSFSAGTITSYSWTFGDGNTASGVVVTNTYSTTNAYTAWLTITDDLGNTASNSVDITVEFQPLELVATATPTSGEVPLDVVFDASASVPSGVGSISSYSWTFGDGNSDSGAIVSNTYDSVGVYTSEVVIADSNGFSATNTFVIDVVPVRFVDFTTQQSGTTGSDAFPAEFTPVSTNDLANADQTTFLSIVDNNGGIVVAQVANINDGATGTSANDGNQVVLEAEDSFTITFDTSVNTQGYDITNINTYAAWNPGAGGRSSQGYDVTLTFMDDSTLLISSGTYEANNPASSWTAVYMTPMADNDVIASGVKAITFSNFDEYANGSTQTDVIAYREFDVLGTPTGSGEIGDISYEVLPNGEGLVLSWLGILGVSYGVEATDNLVTTPWSTISSGLPSLGEVIYVTNSLTADQQFYRAYIEE